MGTLVIVGTQWGDEGKGKITNLLSQRADFIVRYQGGDNAGHTVYIGNEKYVFHLLPSGIIEENKKCVIGNGVVINPESLINEIKILKERGIKIKDRLFISTNAHIVFPYHKYIDQLREISKGKIGTTKRGIGPAYSDKYARVGIRACDYINDKIFLNLLNNNLKEKKPVIRKFEKLLKVKAEILKIREKVLDEFKKYVTDTTLLLNKAIEDNKSVLFEGAQGIMLDVDYGTYPYVTSSNPSTGGVCTGAGIPPTKIDKVLGIAKAYTTRVGSGPFPTELEDKVGEYLRETGKEYGATTGRPRRCGWLDLVAVKHSIMISGVNSLAIMKLDVLKHLDKIKVCVAYKYKNKILKTFPYDREIIEKVIPVYKVFRGWKKDIAGIKKYEQLPPTARRYIEFIEKETGVPVSIISTGPSRSETIIKSRKYISF